MEGLLLERITAGRPSNFGVEGRWLGPACPPSRPKTDSAQHVPRVSGRPSEILTAAPRFISGWAEAGRRQQLALANFSTSPAVSCPGVPVGPAGDSSWPVLCLVSGRDATTPPSRGPENAVEGAFRHCKVGSGQPRFAETSRCSTVGSRGALATAEQAGLARCVMSPLSCDPVGPCRAGLGLAGL